MRDNAKRLLSSWIPPRALAVLRRQPRHVWSGVYDSYAAVPRRGDGYEGSRLARDGVAATAAVIARLQSNLEEPAPRDGGLLALLAATVQTDSQPTRIVDFGGGAGIDYVLLRALIRSRPFTLDYTVVERPIMCELARVLHRSPEIRFVSALDAVREKPDVVYTSAALAYVEPWRDVLSQLMALRPTYIVLANTFCGSFPTYATAQQNVRPDILPCWFLSLDELVGLARAKGYGLVLELRTGLDYDQTNLPVERRPGRARNLVFHEL